MSNVTFDDLFLPAFNFTFSLGLPFMISVYVVFLVLYVVYSAVLIYHWSSFGMKSPEVVFAESLFTIVSLALFALAGVSIYFF